jgi:hypothetical protein
MLLHGRAVTEFFSLMTIAIAESKVHETSKIRQNPGRICVSGE